MLAWFHPQRTHIYIYISKKSIWRVKMYNVTPSNLDPNTTTTATPPPQKMAQSHSGSQYGRMIPTSACLAWLNGSVVSVCWLEVSELQPLLGVKNAPPVPQGHNQPVHDLYWQPHGCCHGWSSAALSTLANYYMRAQFVISAVRLCCVFSSEV